MVRSNKEDEVACKKVGRTSKGASMKFPHIEHPLWGKSIDYCGDKERHRQEDQIKAFKEMESTSVKNAIEEYEDERAIYLGLKPREPQYW